MLLELLQKLCNIMLHCSVLKCVMIMIELEHQHGCSFYLNLKKNNNQQTPAILIYSSVSFLSVPSPLVLTPVQDEEGAFRSTWLAFHTCAWRPRLDAGAWFGARDNIPVQRPGPKQAWYRTLQRGCHCEHTRWVYSPLLHLDQSIQ